jgi:Xaa-Pro aminopeptidase
MRAIERPMECPKMDATAPTLTEAEQLRRALVAEKHAQARALLREHGIDCWLTYSREGSDHLLPLVIGFEYLVGTAALMLFADGPSVAVVTDGDVNQVDGIFDSVLTYSSDWTEPFLQTLIERGPARIGVNYSERDDGCDGLTHGMYLRLVRALEPAGLSGALVSAEPVAGRVRARKSPEEIERMRRACAVTQRIFDDLTGMVRPGLTELDVAEIVRERMQTYGVGPSWEASWCPTVSSSKSRGGHGAPGMTTIEPGDTLRVDLGVFVDGYASDLQRTWYLRRPGESAAPPEIVRAFEAVRDGIALATETLKPGAIGWDVDAPTRAFLAERGFAFTHALGHQVGRRAHDGGVLLGPNNTRYGYRSGGTVEAGMVFTLEPCVDPIALEENVVVTPAGCDWLVAPQRELYLV